MSSSVPEEKDAGKTQKEPIPEETTDSPANLSSQSKQEKGVEKASAKPVGGVDRQALLKLKKHIINVSFLSEQLQRAQEEVKVAKQQGIQYKNKAESLQLQAATTQISLDQQRARCVELEEASRGFQTQLEEKTTEDDAERKKLNSRLASVTNLKDQLVIEVDQLRSKLKTMTEGSENVGALRRQLKAKDGEVDALRSQLTQWKQKAEASQEELTLLHNKVENLQELISSKKEEKGKEKEDNDDEEEEDDDDDRSLEHLNHALELKGQLETEKDETIRLREQLQVERARAIEALDQLNVEKKEKEEWMRKSQSMSDDLHLETLTNQLRQSERQKDEWEYRCRQAEREGVTLRERLKVMNPSQSASSPALNEELTRLRLERDALRDQMVTLCVQLHQIKIRFGVTTPPISSPAPSSSTTQPKTHTMSSDDHYHEGVAEEPVSGRDQEALPLQLPSDEDLEPAPALPAPIETPRLQEQERFEEERIPSSISPKLCTPTAPSSSSSSSALKRPRALSGTQIPSSIPDDLSAKKPRTKRPRPPPSFFSGSLSSSNRHPGQDSPVKELPEPFSKVLPRLEKALETDRSILVEELPRFRGCFEKPEHIQAFSSAIQDLWASFRTAGTLGDTSSTPGSLSNVLFDASLGLSRLSLPSYLPRRERNALILLWSFHSYYPEAGLVDVILQWMGPQIAKALQEDHSSPSALIASASRAARTFGALCRAGNLRQRFRVLIHDLFILHTEEGKWTLLLVMDNLARSWPDALKPQEASGPQEERLPGLLDIYESILSDIVTQTLEEGGKKEAEVAKRAYWIFTHGCGWRPPQESAYMDHLHVRFKEELEELRTKEQTQSVIDRIFECERALDLTTPLWEEAQKILQEQGTM